MSFPCVLLSLPGCRTPVSSTQTNLTLSVPRCGSLFPKDLKLASAAESKSPRPYLPKLLRRSIASESVSMPSPCSPTTSTSCKVGRMHCPALELRDRQDLITYPRAYLSSPIPNEPFYDEHHHFIESDIHVAALPDSSVIKSSVEFTSRRGVVPGVSMAEILRCRSDALEDPDDQVLFGEEGRDGITVVQFWWADNAQFMEKRSIPLSCWHGWLTRHTLAHNVCRLFRDVLLPPDPDSSARSKPTPNVISYDGKMFDCDFLNLRLVSVYTEGAGIWKVQVAVVEEEGY